jgi:hypothetical protein
MIKDVKVSVRFKPNKSLVNNNYQSIKYSTNNSVSFFTKLINLYNKYFS